MNDSIRCCCCCCSRSSSFPASLLSQSPRSPRARLNPHIAIGSAAVSLVVPQLLELSDHHAEAAAALRVIFAASPAAIAARDVFRRVVPLLLQFTPVMFVLVY